MRPLQLELEGFTAFRSRTRLDFAGLDLFAIVGPTGSGKSSLLDAVTWALYGHTPRLLKSGLSALIAQGETVAEVLFTFESGGQTYRVLRRIGEKASQNQLRFERQAAADRWVNAAGEGGAGKRGVDAAIAEAVGLDFESFTRAVLLPQGQFQRFLTETGRKRQDLLGSLVGLPRVRRMHTLAGERRSAARTRADAHEASLAHYADVTAGAIEAAEAQRTAAQRGAQAAQERLAELEVRIAQQTAWLGSERALHEARAALRRLAAAQPAALAGQTRAAAARQVLALLPLLHAGEGAKERARSARTRLQAAERAHTAAAGAAEQAAQHQEAAQAAAHEEEALRRQAEALIAAQALVSTHRRLVKHAPRAEGTAPQPWDEERYAELLERRAAAESLQRERDRLERELGVTEREAARLDERRALCAALEDEVAAMLAAGQELKEQWEALNTRLQEQRRLEAVPALRAALRSGEPCPVCLGTVRQLPPPLEHDAALEHQHAEAAEALQRQRDSYRERLGQAKSERQATTRDAERLTRHQAELQAALAAAQGEPVAALGQELAALWAGLGQELARWPADPAAERQRLLGRAAELREAAQAAAKAAQAAEQRLQGARQARDFAARELQDREHEAEEAQARVSAALGAAGLSEAEARAGALPPEEIEALERAAREHAHEQARLQGRTEELEGELLGAQPSAEALAGLQAERTHTQLTRDHAQQQAASLGERLTTLRRDLSRRQQLERDLTEDQARATTWQVLHQELNANNFQDHLLKELEAELLAAASTLLLDISDDRYRLVLDESGNYAVQDLWNDGLTRSVKTLSGGESFLASLSLAIALSDHLAGRKVLGSLFLDEGFGTLDPLALEAVAGALERLRTSGRSVGIVTHVESLAERMPVRITVSKSQMGSSVTRD